VDVNGLTIAHLYPEAMNIYGDTGNVIALTRRLQWRDLEARVDRVRVGEPYDFTTADIVVAGGGEDLSQLQVAGDLQRRAQAIREAVESGTVFLTVCGTYQLFGHRFITRDGEEIPGIGVFDLETRGGSKRMIGNIVLDTRWGRLVGFENHSGRTFLAAGQESLGTVSKGYGNNDRTAEEGAMTANAFGTYLHGSLLPKNPGFADELILRGMRRRHGGDMRLQALDDDLEGRAAAAAAKRG
jgi:CobQ-like glutamine amidotransferase family enzyme